MKKILFILSLLFVLFSFSPSVFEIYHIKDLPKERTFELTHNYLFDYNFYLSRIRQGQEGRWLVTEKYYNQPHSGSLFQIIFLYLGKIGGWFRLTPPVIYHASRLLFGLVFLILTAHYILKIFRSWWSLAAFLLTVTAGSWPVLVKTGNFWRFATYMGWWSAVDSLQRITFIPHVVAGQIFILVFIWKFSQHFKPPKSLKLLMWGIIGFIVGIIFPPTLVVVYTVFGVLSVLELFFSLSSKPAVPFGRSLKLLMRSNWVKQKVIPRFIFIVISLPSFFYLQLMFKVLPWSALALFDIQHRMPLPYKEYALSLGPVLPLGIIGLILALMRSEKKLFPVISWIVAVGLLFFIFERIPLQSPLRFTEAAIHIPLGILATYLFFSLSYLCNKCKRSLAFVIKKGVGIVIAMIIVMGLGVMGSMVGWLTDQGRAKRVGTWTVPIGAQLIYPLKDFMDGIYFIRDNTDSNQVVLSYVTAGNYIPAYAGNFVYLGHANTPDEEGKEKIAASFFTGKMGYEEAKHFLTRERVSYIYFGPQERELGRVNRLESYYPFLMPIYNNRMVIIYKVI